MKKITIVVDFDGTCVKHEYPKVGGDIGAVSVLKELVEAGHKLVLFTMRSDKGVKEGKFDSGLTDAVNWFKENDIPLYGVQTNPTQKHWTDSPKAYGQLMIDDAALGTPLVHPEDGSRAYVDWNAVRYLLNNMGLLGDSNE